MSELNVATKPKRTPQPNSSTQQQQPIEFSKKLAYFDIVSWVAISLVLLCLLFKEPMLGTYIQNIFMYVTTAYVSLRLGYTAKAGVENYQKIQSAFRATEDDDSIG